MRRSLVPLLVLGSLATAVGICYGDVLFRGRQFGYRDAAHFYYPLYQKVEAEWDAGRWPLWEPEENAGMPLLGNPTAAVLYPGKLLYRVLPYAWGARLYVVAHTALAFAGMFLLLRFWGTSVAGSGLGALAYSFGAPILFQYCNIIFLVGAAWTPFGFLAVDRWLRLGRRSAPVELAVVLAMQMLGGDPESAYLTGVCAGGYALGLARSRAKEAGAPRRRARIRWVLVLGAIAFAWWFGTIELAARLPAFRPHHKTPWPFPWMGWVPPLVLGLWGLAGVGLVGRWWRRRPGSELLPMLAGLIGSATLAAGLAAAQLLPVLEFTAQSGRAAGSGPHDIYPFSLETTRIVEFLWPNVFGTHFDGNRSWLSLVPPTLHRAKVWVPSLYLGGLGIVLALGSIGFRGGPPGRAWLSGIAVLSLVLSLGEYSSPIWWARWDRATAARIGSHDPDEVAAIRLDGKLRDGDGGVYWLLATILPGFRQFRFPSKLLSFTALALAGLAGIGWDRSHAEGRRRAVALATLLLAVSLAALVGVTSERSRIVSAFASNPASRFGSSFGPFDPAGAFLELRSSLLQGTVVAVASLTLIVVGGRRPGLAGGLALLLATADLTLANARYVRTVPQNLFERTPRVAALIADAERARPGEGPYRVHRMPIWSPVAWLRDPSPDRVRDFVEWERDTIQPKYGIPSGIQYTWTLGTAELYDYDWFFGGFPRMVDAEDAGWLRIASGAEIVVYPRRAFDLWNTRYFVIPAYPKGWRDENRGFASFLQESERIYPRPNAFDGPDGPERQTRWVEREDFQIYRNLTSYPRAWVVHAARFIKPIVGLDRADREAPMQEMLFENKRLWIDPSLRVYDPRSLAWMDLDKQPELRPYLPGTSPSSAESVTISRHESHRVELDAVLRKPGIVVLADVYYPGWTLTIDGQAAPIYRTNRMMRGAAVPAGDHHLVYTFDPRSFRIGGRITLATLAFLAVFGAGLAIRPFAAASRSGQRQAPP